MRRVVEIPVNFGVDMGLLRDKVREILEDDPRMVEQPLVQLAEADADCATVWIRVMATDGFAVRYLHNEVRESIIAFLRDHAGARRRHSAAVERRG